ncbi:MAG: hypothetical protein M0R73_00445 [Dehalococcoidia bacterium]|nr:hypothetical protein [Dehalococcoidia bacterium]
MSRYLQPAFLPILAGLLLGILAAATIIDTQPAYLGWLFGIGIGLMGGSFLAAIASGDSLVSGPSAGRSRPGGRGKSAAPWLDGDDEA